MYPEVGLKEARERRDKAREMLRDGIDPSAHRQDLKRNVTEEFNNNFKAVVNEWLNEKNIAKEWTCDYERTVRLRLENKVFPWIGAQPIAEIKPPDLLKVLRRIQDSGALETAHRILAILGQIFRYAVITVQNSSNLF